MTNNIDSSQGKLTLFTTIAIERYVKPPGIYIVVIK